MKKQKMMVRHKKPEYPLEELDLLKDEAIRGKPYCLAGHTNKLLEAYNSIRRYLGFKEKKY